MRRNHKCVGRESNPRRQSHPGYSRIPLTTWIPTHQTPSTNARIRTLFFRVGAGDLSQEDIGIVDETYRLIRSQDVVTITCVPRRRCPPWHQPGVRKFPTPSRVFYMSHHDPRCKAKHPFALHRRKPRYLSERPPGVEPGHGASPVSPTTATGIPRFWWAALAV